MQVKKFEAPTIQEALDTIKRELGPEAIILQTKKYSRGFGLMSKASVEVTAAVSDRSLQKKQFAETRLPDATKARVKGLPADRQAEFLDKYAQKHTRPAVSAAQESPIDAVMRSGGSAPPSKVDVKRNAQASAAPSSSYSGSGKKLTATRYADIEDQQPAGAAPRASQKAPAAPTQRSTQAESSHLVNEEIRLLKRMIEELKSNQESAQGSGAQALLQGGALGVPALQDAYEQLVLNGMDKRYAHGLLKTVAFELGEERSRNPDDVMEQLASEIMKTTEVDLPFGESASHGTLGNGPKIIALVGPTGVGKTTTVAKLASEAILKRNLKVGLINLDSYKVAAFDQLGTYAKILNVPFRSCGTAEELKAAIQDFKSLDLVVVDTTGRSQRDPESLREMQEILKSADSVQTQLVLSVTTRDNELYDMANRFAIFRPQGIIVSKLDEATLYGAIYNVSQKVKLPLLYFTTGQRVPEDIEEASRERVAALILDL